MKRWAVLALFALVLVGPSQAKTLVYGQSSLPVTLDAAAAQDGNSLRVAKQVAGGQGLDLLPAQGDPIPRRNPLQRGSRQV